MANTLLTNEIENWLPVVDYESLYEVSDFGRVKSLDRMVRSSANPEILVPRSGRVLKLCRINDSGHLEVSLSKYGKVRKFLVHHLVLVAFVSPRPAGLIGLHWDDDPSNNRPSNLRWGTYSDNGFDCARNGGWGVKTHCPQKHEYTTENTYVTRAGSKVCRRCRNDKGRAAYMKRQQREAVSV